MKIRSNYVSNSSSSSYVIAYDPVFFGNFEEFLREYSPGCDTSILNLNTFIEDYPEYKERIAKLKAEGKQVIYFSLDYEHNSLMELMKMINESNGGNKMEILLDGED